MPQEVIQTEDIKIIRASENEIKGLSQELEKLLEDKKGALYRDSVEKFGIPENYARKAFSEENLLKTAKSGKASFYLALEHNREMLGFSEVIKHDSSKAELDRLVIFPGHERKGIGTKLLERAISDLEQEGVRTIEVRAGKDEAHARAFYEKNGFKKTADEIFKSPWGKNIPLVLYSHKLTPINRRLGQKSTK